MNRSGIVQIVRDYLGFSKMNEEIILRHLDMVQTIYESGQGAPLPLPWFMQKTIDTDTAAQTESGVRTVALPSNFIEFIESWPITIFTSEGAEKRMTRCEVTAMPYAPAETGFPEYYDSDGRMLYLYKLPDAVYDVNIPHFASTTQFSTTETNDWFTYFPRLLAADVWYSISLANRDQGGLSMANNEVAKERDAAFRLIESKKHSMMDYEI